MKQMLLLVLLFTCGCSDKRFSFDTVMKLHAHQTYPEVVAILGNPATVQRMETEPLTLIAEWGLEDGRPRISVRFTNGEVDRIGAFRMESPKWSQL